MMVQRYRYGWDDFEESDVGEFVKHEDYEKLVLWAEVLIQLYDADCDISAHLENIPK